MPLRVYSPRVHGDLLYAIILIAVFAGLLLAVWGVDRLLSRTGRPDDAVSQEDPS